MTNGPKRRGAERDALSALPTVESTYRQGVLYGRALGFRVHDELLDAAKEALAWIDAVPGRRRSEPPERLARAIQVVESERKGAGHGER
jgi:hypothetical protein